VSTRGKSISIAITLIGLYVLLRAYAEPIAQLATSFCVGWCAASAGRAVARHLDRERART